MLYLRWAFLRKIFHLRLLDCSRRWVSQECWNWRTARLYTCNFPFWLYRPSGAGNLESLDASPLKAFNVHTKAPYRSKSQWPSSGMLEVVQLISWTTENPITLVNEKDSKRGPSKSETWSLFERYGHYLVREARSRHNWWCGKQWKVVWFRVGKGKQQLYY